MSHPSRPSAAGFATRIAGKPIRVAPASATAWPITAAPVATGALTPRARASSASPAICQSLPGTYRPRLATR